MPADDDSPVDLTTASTEIEAQSIVSALREEGIQADVLGGSLAGLRAEAPGLARVVVRRADLARARELLKSVRLEASAIDWDKVDVGEPEGGVDIDGRCFRCGYDMTGLDGQNRCPECGLWLLARPEPGSPAPLAPAVAAPMLRAAAKRRQWWVIVLISIGLIIAAFVAVAKTLEIPFVCGNR